MSHSTVPDIPLSSMPGHLIRRLHQISTAIFQERVKSAGFDVTPVQYAALTVLHDNPGIDQARLASLIAYDRATIGGVIDRLETRNLVKRVVSAKDRRAREVSLTEAGETKLAKLRPVVEDLQKDILVGLSHEEAETFTALCHKIAKNT